mmetsp:Transcript_13536/g.37214  ORF Transcript_13536/g.37214 Transcript_13536/m.37214 type:complete len:238 (+) Transcript_13536:357-1070(+)
MVVPHVIVTYHLNLFSTSLEGMQSRIEPVPVVAVVKRHAHQHPKLFPSSDQCQRRARGGRALRLCDALMGIHDVRRVVVVLLLLVLPRLGRVRGLILGDRIKFPPLPPHHRQVRIFLHPLRMQHHQRPLPSLPEVMDHLLDLVVLEVASLVVLVVEAHVRSIDDDVVRLLLPDPALESAEAPVAAAVVRQLRRASEELLLLRGRNPQGLQTSAGEAATPFKVDTRPTHTPAATAFFW